MGRTGRLQGLLGANGGEAPGRQKSLLLSLPSKGTRGGRHTHLDGSVTRGRHDVLIIEVHHVDSSSVADQDTPQSDIGGGSHVPHGDGAVLGAGHHQAVAEAQVQDGLVVVDQRVQNLARVHVPDSGEHRSTTLNERDSWGKSMVSTLSGPILSFFLFF